MNCLWNVWPARETPSSTPSLALHSNRERAPAPLNIAAKKPEVTTLTSDLRPRSSPLLGSITFPCYTATQSSLLVNNMRKTPSLMKNHVTTHQPEWALATPWPGTLSTSVHRTNQASGPRQATHTNDSSHKWSPNSKIWGTIQPISRLW